MLEATKLLNVTQTIFVNPMLVICKISQGLLTKRLMEESLVAALQTCDTRLKSNFHVSSVRTASD